MRHKIRNTAHQSHSKPRAEPPAPQQHDTLCFQRVCPWAQKHSTTKSMTTPHTLVTWSRVKSKSALTKLYP